MKLLQQKYIGPLCLSLGIILNRYTQHIDLLIGFLYGISIVSFLIANTTIWNSRKQFTTRFRK